MVNPFLDTPNAPAAMAQQPSTPTGTVPAAGTAPPEDIHHNIMHPLPADSFHNVGQGPDPSQEIRDGLEGMMALTNRIKELEAHMLTLQREREHGEENARQFNAESNRTRGLREGTFASNSTYTNEHPRSKIKPSDLPKFYGKDNEDIDEWIEKVSAIFTYSGARDTELLRILPLLLQGNASEWFTTLGDEGRARLLTWDAWKAALRNGFYLPDHEMTKRMLCRNRMLKRTESFGDYFQARKALQRYVYPCGTLIKF
jgi:hypothetical protein